MTVEANLQREEGERLHSHNWLTAGLLAGAAVIVLILGRSYKRPRQA